MAHRPGKAVLTVLFLAGGVLVLPFVVAYLLANVVPEVVPEWVIRSVCVGFLCSLTLVVVVFGVAMCYLWVLVRLHERGYLLVPREW
jgi:hypothetical protein